MSTTPVQYICATAAADEADAYLDRLTAEGRIGPAVTERDTLGWLHSDAPPLPPGDRNGR